MNISNFIEELKRRNVFKVATVYAIAGWLIIQVIDTIGPQLGFPEWVPPFFTVLVLIGLPLSLIFAWAFELTPDGIKKSKEVEITKSVTDRTGKKLNGIIIGVLSVALFFVVIERVFFAKASFLEDVEASSSVQSASIAVLPFVNMSSDEENEFFSDGLSEELLNALAGIEDMKVAGRTSSFKFKGQNEDLKLIGEQLGVSNILEGSVRKSGNRVRITAQLIRVEDGFHMWSKTYDRELTATDIFDIQEEISRQVMQELKVRLLPEEDEQLASRPTQDIEAYNAFLEATQLEISQDLNELEKAVEKYKAAIRIDPNFALAYARLALLYGDLNWKGNLSLEDMKELMRENIDRALLINGNLGKAYEALGYYYLNIEDNQKALETYERAIELLPGDAEVLVGYHDVLHEFSMHSESHKILESAYEIDPLNPEIATHLGNHYVNLEEQDKGLELFDSVLENNPNYMDAKRAKANALGGIGIGKIDKAFINIYEVYKTDTNNVDLIVNLHGLSESLGLYKIQEHFVKRMGEEFPNNQYYYFMYANYYSEHGKIDEVLDFIETGRGVFSDNFNKEIDTFRARLAYLNGEKEDAIRMYEEFNPEILADVVEINNTDKANDVATYLSYLNSAGLNDTKRYNYLTEIYCGYVENRYDEASNEAIKKYRKWDLGSCEFYKGNTDEYLEMLREQYFDFKLKSGFPDYFKNSRNAQMMSDNPVYKQLREDILADVALMRDDVIEYLKAEGEWKEEWEVSE